MPELPEVENVVQAIKQLQNSVIDSCWLSGKRLRYNLLQDELMLPLTIRNVQRLAKYIVFYTDRGYLVFHLGMTGMLYIRPKDASRAAHCHMVLQLNGDRELHYVDTRRFGGGRLMGNLASLKVGIEPLSDELNIDSLNQAIGGSSVPIKNMLLQQDKIAGIGNIYASEILFEAGIAPTKPANKLTKNDQKRLILATKSILTRAIEAGGSTIRSYVNSNGQSGGFQKQFTVYGRAGQQCRLCARQIILIKMAGRATYFCSSCQSAEDML